MAGEYESVELVEDRYVENLTTAAVIAALTAAFAYVSVPYPLSSVPITLQTIGVAMAGLALGPVWGGFSMGVYVLVGALGVPVFAGGTGGLGYLLGPKGGYLFGFVLAAIVTGAIVHRSARARPLSTVWPLWQVAGLFAGMVAVYLAGVPWLAALTGLSLQKATVTGGIVFLPGDVAKLAVAFALVRAGEFALE